MHFWVVMRSGTDAVRVRCVQGAMRWGCDAFRVRTWPWESVIFDRCLCEFRVETAVFSDSTIDLCVACFFFFFSLFDFVLPAPTYQSSNCKRHEIICVDDKSRCGSLSECAASDVNSPGQFASPTRGQRSDRGREGLPQVPVFVFKGVFRQNWPLLCRFWPTNQL